MIVPSYQRTEQVQARAATPVQAAQSAAGAVGEGLIDVGDALDEWQDQIDTAAAKELDNQYADLIRETLYGDEGGFMYTSGGDAVGRHRDVDAALSNALNGLLGEQSPRVTAKAKAALDARRLRARQSIDQHVAAEGRSYINQAASARIVSATNDAIYSPSDARDSLLSITTELQDMAAREGWAPEVLDVKTREARSSVHTGIIGRIEKADPIQALEYLNENRSDMTGADIARLEAVLIPKAREKRGRQLGAEAASGDQSPVVRVVEARAGVTVVELANGDVVTRDGTRAWRNNNPGNIEYGEYAKSRGAVGSDGRFAIFPSYEAGRAAKSDLLFETKSYRNLSIADAIGRYAPDFENDTESYSSQVAAAAGVPKTTLMSDLSPSQREAVLDAMERVEGYKTGSETGRTPVEPGGIQSLLDIEDPDERAAAISEYNLITGVQRAQAEAARSNAQDEAFRLIEEGGSINDLPLDYRKALGQEAMTSLRSYQSKIAAGTPVRTDTELFVQLSELAASDPEAFISSDPLTWRDRLDDSDFEYFTKKRADMRSGAISDAKTASEQVSLSAIRTASKTALSAAGIDGAQDIARFESSMIRWETDFANAQGRLPTPAERQDRINQQLVPIVLDPSGGFNKQASNLYDIDFQGEPLDPDDDITLDILSESTLKINGIKVDPETMAIFARGFFDRFQRDPSAQELVDGLVATGLYQ